MNLYLLRHGLAVDPGTPGYEQDADRPLTPKGERKLRKIAEALLALDVELDVILSSPLLRARQTAEIVAAAFGARHPVTLTDALAPDGNPRKLLAGIEGLTPVPGNVMLVGHEPFLSQLVSLLLSGDPGLSIVMKKGGVCKLSAEALRPGRCATLEWLLTPKHITGAKS